MDSQSKGAARGRSHYDANVEYVEATVFVTNRFPERGFAFGIARINGRDVEVFIGKRGCAKKLWLMPWQKLPEKEQFVPWPQDELKARIRLTTEPGKKPSAVLWEVQPDFDPWLYEQEMEQTLEEGSRYMAQHEAECDGCSYCNPTSFRPEY